MAPSILISNPIKSTLKIKETHVGSVFRRTFKDKDGKKRTLAIWWIKYYSHGRVIRETAGTADYAEAKEYLKQREGEATKRRPTKSLERKVIFSELASLVEKDYELNGYRSAADIELRHRLHIIPFFGKMKVTQITETTIDDYILQRREEGSSNASINRELATIKRAFSLGIQKRIVSDRPHITMLKEDNVRTGFFELDQFQAVLKHLPDVSGGKEVRSRIEPVARFAYVTGWRKNEILKLQWRQVDFEARVVILDVGTTKNRKGRVFPFTDELEAVLNLQRTRADGLKEKGIITPWVFFYTKGVRKGRPFVDFKHSWEAACKAAGVPGRLVHDFRRTAVRNLVRAGVPEGVAMKMTGHKTRSVFERYNIVSEGDLRDAAVRLDAFSMSR